MPDECSVKIVDYDENILDTAHSTTGLTGTRGDVGKYSSRLHNSSRRGQACASDEDFSKMHILALVETLQNQQVTSS